MSIVGTPWTGGEPKLITKLAYLMRFTQAERISIRASTAPEVVDLMALVSEATHIDLDHTATASGLALLESLSLVSSGRVSEIRTASVNPAERPA